MGYDARGTGNITLKDGLGQDRINEVYQTLKSVFDDVYKPDRYNDSFTVCYNGKYHDEDLFETYSKITDAVKEASIEFQGDDDALWKHEFRVMTNENGEKVPLWTEFCGHIEYDKTGRTVALLAKEEKDDIEPEL